MITSQPKIKAVFALSAFVALVYAALFFMLQYILKNQVFAWWVLLLAGIVAALAFGLTFKGLNDFKSLRLSNNRLSVRSYFGLVREELPLDELKAWTEVATKTHAEPFVEITLVFARRKHVKLNNQQDAGFADFAKYLKKKKPKLQLRLGQKGQRAGAKK